MKLLPLVTILAAGSTLSAQWTAPTLTQAPAPVSWPGMAFDAGNNEVVLFGGFDNNALTNPNGTWLYDGTNWTQPGPATEPPLRDSQGMVYDSANQRVVLFGGLDAANVHFNDTWTWDGTTWTQLSPTTSPPARATPGMAYDGTRNRVVMFGGFDWNGFSSFGDTWEFDGATWTNANPANAPSARDGHAMWYDPVRDRTYLFGGIDANGFELGDTWEWDGTDWTQLSPPASPSPRYYVQASFDSARGVAVLTGGFDGGTQAADTWEFDGTDWTMIAAAPTPARDSHGTAFDSNRGTTVVFGGWDGTGDVAATNEYAPGPLASYTLFGSGCPGSNGTPALAPQSGSLPVMGSTFSLDITNLPVGAGVAYVVLGFSNTVWNGTPLPMSLASFGVTGCDLYVSPDMGTVLVHSGATATWQQQVPTGAAFAGLTFFNQAASFDTGAANGKVAVSNAGKGIVN